MKKLLIIDGSNLLFQMFYGMPARIVSPAGKPIHGVVGFVGALLKILRMTRPTHAAVIFDGEHGNERNILDSDYKAQRPDFSEMPEEETPFSQLDGIYAALDRLGLRHTETEGYEADDIIASYACRLGGEYDIVISSFDSDFFQLISPRVSVLRYRGKGTVICGPDYVREKFGVPPESYADFKALVGDSADNIRGAAGIGPKTAAALIGQFGSLGELLRRTEEIKKPSVRASVAESRARLDLNYRLIRLDGRAPLPFEPEDLSVSSVGVTTTQVLRETGLI